MDYMLLTSETGITMLLFIIGLIVVTVAQIKISSTYSRTRKIKLNKTISGSEIARLILDNNGLNNIHVVETKGELTDHYDPGRKVIKLSTAVFHGEDVAAAAVASHEVGHAIQDKVGYKPMRIRHFLVPIVNFVTYAGYFVSIISLIAGITNYILVGIVMILAALLFQLITLPVEFNASSRAKVELKKLNILTPKQQDNASSMLSAAAFTYVASFVSTIMNLLRLVIMYNDRKD